MYNLSLVVPVKLSDQLGRFEVNIPDGKYLKSASISLVKYGSSNCDVHLQCQLGNTTKETPIISLCYGKEHRTNAEGYKDKISGKVFAFGATALNAYKFGFACLIEEKSNKTETEEAEEKED